jgi:hypothetical protein
MPMLCADARRGYGAGLFGLTLLAGLLLATRSEPLVDLAMELEPTPFTEDLVQRALWWDGVMDRAGIKPTLSRLQERIGSLRTMDWPTPD